MAVSLSRTHGPQVPGAEKATVTLVTLDDSYPTGGEAITAAQLGLGTVDYAICSLYTAATGTDDVDAAIYKGGKLVCFITGAQVANEADLTGAVIQVVAYGH